jgi:hypothetical protein
VVKAKGSVCVCVRQFHPFFDDDAKEAGLIKSRHLLAFSSRILLLGKHWLAWLAGKNLEVAVSHPCFRCGIRYVKKVRNRLLPEEERGKRMNMHSIAACLPREKEIRLLLLLW